MAYDTTGKHHTINIVGRLSKRVAGRIKAPDKYYDEEPPINCVGILQRHRNILLNMKSEEEMLREHIQHVNESEGGTTSPKMALIPAATLDALNNIISNLQNPKTKAINSQPAGNGGAMKSTAVRPNPFTGSGDYTAQEFVEEMDQYFLESETNDKRKLKMTVINLREHALTWWTWLKEDMGEDAANSLTWPEFKNLLLNRFDEEYGKLRDGITLLRLKQTGTLKAYVQEFRGALNILPQMDEYAKKLAFIAGLEHWAERALLRMEHMPDTCEELLRMAETIRDHKGQQSKSEEYTSASSPRRKQTQKAKKRKWPLNGAKGKRKVEENKKESKKEPKSGLKCHHCKEGHFIQDHPTYGPTTRPSLAKLDDYSPPKHYSIRPSLLIKLDDQPMRDRSSSRVSFASVEEGFPKYDHRASINRARFERIRSLEEKGHIIEKRTKGLEQTPPPKPSCSSFKQSIRKLCQCCKR
jgi:hypothetical protein